jgi:hypothetical protein
MAYLKQVLQYFGFRIVVMTSQTIIGLPFGIIILIRLLLVILLYYLNIICHEGIKTIGLVSVLSMANCTIVPKASKVNTCVILVCEHNELKADHTSAILYLA